MLRRSWSWLLSLVVVGVVLAAVDPAAGQGPRPRRSYYAPSRPTLSPYLYLSRGSVGGVPAYQAWVRPRLEYDQRQQQIDSEFNYVERQIMRPQTATAGEKSQAATFMNYSHYYQRPNTAGR